jgi:hypothetical protein
MYQAIEMGEIIVDVISDNRSTEPSPVFVLSIYYGIISMSGRSPGGISWYSSLSTDVKYSTHAWQQQQQPPRSLVVLDKTRKTWVLRESPVIIQHNEYAVQKLLF